MVAIIVWLNIRLLWMKISVCLATYNGARFIEEQLKSVLDQLLPGDELVIADDGSTDDTLKIIRSFSGPIKIVADSRVGGAVRNFERVISSAQGEAIVLCDQDDVWLPGRLELFRKHLQQNTVVMLNGSVIDQGGFRSEQSVYDLVGVRSGFWANFYKNSFIGCCMGFRAELREKLLPFPSELPWHDWYIGLFAELAGNVYRSEKVSFFYRRHEHNASSTGEVSKESILVRIIMRLRILKALFLAFHRGSRISRNHESCK